MASFNIQVLGAKKIGKPEVLQNLLKILSRYDLVFVQEVRDSSDSAFHTLASDLNAYTAKSTGKRYNYVLSERLGRSNSKEQYGVLYNEELIKLEKTIQYNDVNNWFERPPYTFVFTLKTADAALKSTQFAILGCHVKPTDAVNEISHLRDVFDSFKGEKFYNNQMIMGDLNAGCSYVSKTKMQTITLRTDTRFSWLIPDSADTTVASGDCPYDRFIVLKTMDDAKIASGSSFQISNVGVFKFDSAYGLSTAEAALVSDHYPIELSLDTKAKIGSSSKTLADLVAEDFEKMFK